MKYRYLIFNRKEITNHKLIEKILHDNLFYWIIDAEIEEAEIEIINNTIIWHYGIWLSGTWHYGIWESGEFRWGTWKNGIFEDGEFIDGVWESGIVKNGKISDSVKVVTITKK